MTNIFDFVKSIESSYKNNLSLQPKATYVNDDGFHYGIFYHKKLNKFIFVDEDNTFTEMEPVTVLFPNEYGDYGMTDDELYDFIDYDFMGAADDLSCIIYFRQVKK